jgi:glycosyltransferase involved in cell wall biosynthesis
MPNVLFITPFIWETGPWRGKPTVHNIIRGFQRAGYEVHVVTCTNKPQPTDTIWEGVHLHYFRLPFSPAGLEFDAFHSFLTQVSQAASPWRRHLTFRWLWLQFVWFGWRRAAQVARQWPPAFTYGVNNPGIPIAYRVGRQLGVPNFSRIMGSPIMRWLNSPLRLYLARFDELLAFKLPAEALIITDDGTISAEDIREGLGIPSERIWMFRNGIDKVLFTSGPARSQMRTDLGFAPDAKVLLWVSQLVNWKRVDRIIDAMPQVAARCPEVQLVILGDGPDRPLLEAQAKRLGVDHLIRFAGSVVREELPHYFRSADVFTAFYDYGNISNSLLEAMLSGNAVVALNNGHTADVVKHMENGLLVDPECLSDIPDALTRILTDDTLRERLRRAAATYANETLLTWEERIDQELRQIQEIVGQPGRI